MALLDFIKNRQQAGGEQPSQPKPETAKEMYTRTAEQDRASATPMDRIPAEKQARVDAVKSDLQKVTQPSGQEAPVAPSPDATTNPQPMRQNMSNQDKVAPDLSPTSAQSGTPAVEVEGPGAPAATPSKTQNQSQEQQQTVERRPPSWER